MTQKTAVRLGQLAKLCGASYMLSIYERFLERPTSGDPLAVKWSVWIYKKPSKPWYGYGQVQPWARQGDIEIRLNCYPLPLQSPDGAARFDLPVVWNTAEPLKVEVRNNAPCTYPRRWTIKRSRKAVVVTPATGQFMIQLAEKSGAPLDTIVGDFRQLDSSRNPEATKPPFAVFQFGPRLDKREVVITGLKWLTVPEGKSRGMRLYGKPEWTAQSH